MTAVIGIKSNKGLESVVIGSDTQISFNSEEDSKVLDSKRTARKIICGDNWIMAFAGTIDEELYGFYKKLKGLKRYGSSDELVKNMVFNAVRHYDEWKKNPKKYDALHFKEVVDLNAQLMRKKRFKLEETMEFVLGVYLEESGVRLFHVDEFGNLKEPSEDREFNYFTMGSGSDRIEKYITDLVEEDEGGQFFVDTKKAIEIVRRSIHKSSRDIYTGGGIDMAILTSNGVTDYGFEIREALKEAEEKKFQEIGARYDDSETE